LSIQLKYNVVKASNFEYHSGAQFFQLSGSLRQNSSHQTDDNEASSLLSAHKYQAPECTI